MSLDLDFLPRLEALPNRGRTILFETLYGSRLYGTAMADSDVDVRGVYLPSLYDFLRETKEEAAALTPMSDFPATNDTLYFPVGLFIDQVIRMKVNCVEIFLAAEQARAAGARLHPVMEMLLDARADLLSADPAGFIGHARQRASAYVPGDDPNDSTLQANIQAHAILREVADSAPEAAGKRIMDIDGLAERLAAAHPRIARTTNAAGASVLMIHTRQTLENERVGVALEVISQRLARFRKTPEEVDAARKFKDLATALRMVESARDLMRDGTIAYPVLRAAHYRAIRRGQVDVAGIIDDMDAAQEEAERIVSAGISPLREKFGSGAHVPVRDAAVAQARMMALRALDMPSDAIRAA